MSSNHPAHDAGQDLSSLKTSAANELRALLEHANLSQRAAARLLDIDERTMRQWCSGQGRPPASVFRALNPRITWAENTRKQIESNEQVINAMEDGRVTGLGYGRGASDPSSISREINRLRKLNEELQSLLRLDDAFHRRQMAHFALIGDWSPHGSGVPSEGSLAEADAADAEYRAAQDEVDRIAAEIRTGQR
jgi:transcriptional regulator with XRE-family HTH domain